MHTSLDQHSVARYKEKNLNFESTEHKGGKKKLLLCKVSLYVQNYGLIFKA